MIVSNPPYISNKEQGKLQVELSYEPDKALYGGERGDEVLINIIDTFFQREETVLICEMGYNQKDYILEYTAQKGEIEFFNDLAGLHRGFILSKYSL